MERDLEQQIKLLKEENVRLQLQVERLQGELQTCLKNWTEAYGYNEMLVKQLAEVRTEWMKCAENYNYAMNSYAEIENAYKQLLREVRGN